MDEMYQKRKHQHEVYELGTLVLDNLSAFQLWSMIRSHHNMTHINTFVMKKKKHYSDLNFCSYVATQIVCPS